MKVILLQDVKNVGKKGQTIEVSDGYANNFLLPKRLGVNATKRSVEILDKQKEDARILDEKNRKEAEELLLNLHVKQEKMENCLVLYRLNKLWKNLKPVME